MEGRELVGLYGRKGDKKRGGREERNRGEGEK